MTVLALTDRTWTRFEMDQVTYSSYFKVDVFQARHVELQNIDLIGTCLSISQSIRISPRNAAEICG